MKQAATLHAMKIHVKCFKILMKNMYDRNISKRLKYGATLSTSLFFSILIDYAT